jgi:ribosome-associated toxin RatA of RatAB toxin-antitoxin module
MEVVPISATTDNSVVIDAPMDLVWTMTNDVKSWPDLFTEYAAVEILEQDTDSVLFRLTTRPDPDGTVWSWVSRRSVDPAARSVRAHRVETGPFEFMNIRWSFHERANGVEMRWRQEFAVRPGLPLTEKDLVTRLDGTAKEQMSHIKSVVEATARTRSSR